MAISTGEGLFYINFTAGVQFSVNSWANILTKTTPKVEVERGCVFPCII